LTAHCDGRSHESVSRSNRERSNLSALIINHRMGIDICAQWDRMSMAEAVAQVSAKYNGDRGEVGYLSESYYGAPYPTEALVPEAFRYGRARIAASDLQKRLPDALYMVESRELCFGFGKEAEAAVQRLQKQYRDFVALCARKEDETGIPCLIVASY